MEQEKPKTLDGGKGSAPRPIDWDRFEANWEKIFGAPAKEQPEQKGDGK